ncbi:unnamed protein product [Pedinophyceae sp. YPF-701]|nr:unnamed protein product [Pedinophyceae sp. YPF-701]
MSAQMKKKLVIKLNVKPALPPNFEEQTWLKLREAVQAVFRSLPTPASLEELYRAVEDLVVQKWSPQLYQRLKDECDAHVATQLSGLDAKVGEDATELIQSIDVCWQSFCAHLSLVRAIFLSLDRGWVLEHGGENGAPGGLFEMGVGLFRQGVDARPALKQAVLQRLLGMIAAERAGEAVPRPLLRSLLGMLSQLGLYAVEFQPRLLEETRVHYTAAAQRSIDEEGAAGYLATCERWLREEGDRVASYLDAASMRPLTRTLDEVLLQAHVERIVGGLATMMDNEKNEDVARAYTLLGRVSAHDALRTAWTAYITAATSAIVSDASRDAEMVQRLLDLRKRLSGTVAAALGGDESFVRATRAAMEAAINRRQNRPAEMVAKYLDGLLRSGAKGAGSEERVEEELHGALALFRLIQGKDVFEAFYKRDLARRLLLGRSASQDAELRMLGLLREECGAQFTSKLEGMFKDIEVSRDLMAAVRGAPEFQGAAPSGLDMSVSVLTSGFWPSYPVVDAVLPGALQQGQEAFRQVYLAKHNGRNLTWHNTLGSCIIKAKFPKAGTKELQVSLMQCTVLMLFNDADELSYGQIKAGTGIEEKELKRTLQSLACGQVRVLSKEPKGKDVGDADVFRYNEKFEHKMFRIKINSIQAKETPEENQKTNEQVLADRVYAIDAAIVRVMKARKQLSHKLLIGELLQQLRFHVQPSDLKRRIESLIEREYLERAEGETNMYLYRA